MFSQVRFIVPIAVAFAGLFPAPQSAGADHRAIFRHRSRAEADIDSLRASVRPARGTWIVNVCYEVEIEDAGWGENFDLLLEVWQGRRPVLDPQGRPVVVAVPLIHPREVDDDEATFENTVDFALPPGAIGSPRSLRIRARVVGGDGRYSLDDEDARIRFGRFGRRFP